MKNVWNVGIATCSRITASREDVKGGGGVRARIAYFCWEMGSNALEKKRYKIGMGLRIEQDRH